MLEAEEDVEIAVAFVSWTGASMVSWCAFWTAAANVSGRLLAYGVAASCVCLAGDAMDTSEESDGLEKDEL